MDLIHQIHQNSPVSHRRLGLASDMCNHFCNARHNHLELHETERKYPFTASTLELKIPIQQNDWKLSHQPEKLSNCTCISQNYSLKFMIHANSEREGTHNALNISVLKTYSRTAFSVSIHPVLRKWAECLMWSGKTAIYAHIPNALMIRELVPP